jgi:hypothetical protein
MLTAVGAGNLPARLDGAISRYAERLEDTIRYVDVMSRVIVQHPEVLRVFSESSFVLAVAYYEDFLRSLLSFGARYRKPQLRKHLVKGTKPEEQAHIRTCDLPALIHVLRQRLSFKKDARSIDGLFVAIFGMSAWPSTEVRDRILDLVVRPAGAGEAGADV